MAKIGIRRATANDNLLEIAKCLYHTDPFIYPTAFGEDINNATKAIVALIKAGDSIFSYKNMFVAISCNTICGVLLYNEFGANWDTENYYNLVKPYIPCKEKFVYASAHYFLHEAKKPQPNHIEIVALCVARAYRGMGIASKMLEEFIAENTGKILELDVLSDNAIATHLYTKFGFECIECVKGFSYTEENRPDCYHMVRK